MYNDYDKERDAIRPGVPRERSDAPEIIYTPPPHKEASPPVAELVPDVEPVTAEPVAEPVPDAEPVQAAVSLEHAPPPEITDESEYGEWWEPTYTEAQTEDTQMYLSGIGAPEYIPPELEEEWEDEEIKPRRLRRGSIGFVRALCLVVACAVVSLICAYSVLELRIRSGDFSTPPQVVLGAGPAIYRPPIVAASGTMLPEDIYDMACRQVVSIRVTMPPSRRDRPPGLFDVPPGLFDGPAIPRASSGSGFIVSEDGYILTNFHVIEQGHINNWQISVHMFDGESFIATVVGYDRDSDVALIKIDAYGLDPVTIGDSDNIRVGQRVYAVGNPFGDLVYTMSEGIISALDRIVTVEGRTINSFQLTAAVNPGNSGGPVYNTNGEVIGIVTAKFMSSTVEGIGFAIPINDAIDIARSLLEHGFIPDRPLMGVHGQSVSTANAVYFGLVEGFEIHSVNAGSAAENAGIKVGDIITHLDGNRVRSFEELTVSMRRFSAGDTTTVTVWRDGLEYTLNITFDERI